MIIGISRQRANYNIAWCTAVQLYGVHSTLTQVDFEFDGDIFSWGTYLNPISTSTPFVHLHFTLPSSRLKISTILTITC